MATEGPAARRACVVMLGGRAVAVDVASTREVVLLDVTTRVPRAPAAVVGMMNLRGRVLPVLEIRPLLGLPLRAAAGRPRALVLADGDHRAAVLIERVLGLTMFEAVVPLPASEPLGALALGEVTDETGERVTMLDADAVLRAVRRAWHPLVQPSPAVPSAPEPSAPARPQGI